MRRSGPIIHGIDNRFNVVNYGDDFYAMTDYKAQNYQVVKIDMRDPGPDKWKTVVPEGKDVISDITIVGGKLFVTGLHDVVTQTRILRSRREARSGEIRYPTLGAASSSSGSARNRIRASIRFSRSSFRRRFITTT